MHLDFDAARAQRDRTKADAPEPLTFSLGGETFTCIDSIPVGVFVDVIDAGMSNLSLAVFLRNCVVPEDEERLATVLRRKSTAATDDAPAFVAVTGDDMWPIFSALTDVFAGRPTERPSDSPDGSQTTGPTSNGTSSEQATTSGPSST